ncbi:hypothetical protein [Terrimonas pollutisoli]|uniref:hypothetical protein n=1 Tax=Terrimonas pollutisoli TaxID=3034147 RepID=UPI0023EAA24E|nr:hypothetical protein [Terrimonas sp. H1YJ31]
MTRILILSIILSGCTKLYYINNKTSNNQPVSLMFYKGSAITANDHRFSRYSGSKVIHNFEVAENDSCKGYQFQLIPNTKISLSELVNMRSPQANQGFQICLRGQCEVFPYPPQAQHAVLTKSFLLWKVYEIQIKETGSKNIIAVDSTGTHGTIQF